MKAKIEMAKAIKNIKQLELDVANQKLNVAKANLKMD
jgi:hypothetical protein